MDTAILSQDISAQIADRLAQSVGPHKYAMWFDRAARFDYLPQGNHLRVSVPNRFVADWIGRHFRPQIQDAARQTVGRDDVALNLVVEPEHFTHQAVDRSDAAASRVSTTAGQHTEKHDQDDSEDGSNETPGGGGGFRDPQALAARHATELAFNRSPMRHRLERFIAGPSNELAYAAACRIADPEQDAAHPLFVHGGCGLGKTHLLQGACRRMIELDPHAKVVYTTGEQFTNQYIQAVRTHGLDAFRKRIRRLDLLAVDDVHFIANKQSTQKEFLHSFDEIDLGGSRVILASDSHPKLIEQFSEALISRCVRGLVVQVDAPDPATRRRLVQTLARRQGLTLQDTAAATLAGRITGSVREIQGALAKLRILASLNTPTPGTAPGPGSAPGSDTPGSPDQPIGHALVNQLLRDPGSPTGQAPRKPVRFDAILQAVCDRVGVSPQQALGSGRHKHVVLARSLAVYLVRELATMSYPEIASAMGRKNHSTAITADQRIRRQIQADAPVLLPHDREPIKPSALVEELRAPFE